MTASSGEPRVARRRGLLVALAACAAAALAAALLLRDRTPPLTVEALERAREGWRRAGIADYDVRILKELDAQPAERIEAQVRAGKTVALSVNGARVRASDSFTVPELFEVARRELEMASSGAPAPGQPRGAVLRALFHEATGAPLTLKRIASGRQSYVLTVERLESQGKVLWPER
ncbi:MAG: hypothetical protein HY721_03260 [Planctomycetes bacterium]|nr:hypothetical protein [Planctomycetota bacterium]